MEAVPDLADARFVGGSRDVHLSGIQEHDALRLGVGVLVASDSTLTDVAGTAKGGTYGKAPGCEC